MKFEKIIIFLFLMLFLHSCSAKEALQGSKRSENSDEFLVEKKNPLTLPPDINELPVPLDQEEAISNNEDSSLDIKKALQIGEDQNSSNENNNEGQNSLEESILEKINN